MLFYLPLRIIPGSYPQVKDFFPLLIAQLRSDKPEIRNKYQIQRLKGSNQSNQEMAEHRNDRIPLGFDFFSFGIRTYFGFRDSNIFSQKKNLKPN